MSHDLRAPLRSITGFSRILTETSSDRLTADDALLLRRISTGATEANALIDALLELSRAGRHPLDRRPVSMTNLAKEVAIALTDTLSERTATITVAELPDTLADPVLIKQVLTNLLSNAIKYSRGIPDARIQITHQTMDGQTVYQVRDNGAGFGMNQAHKLFQVFERLHSATEFEGTGVGLSIVEKIVHRHGGRIWAEATVGRGAVFSFTVPASPIDSDPPPGPTPSAEHVPGSPPLEVAPN